MATTIAWLYHCPNFRYATILVTLQQLSLLDLAQESLSKTIKQKTAKHYECDAHSWIKLNVFEIFTQNISLTVKLKNEKIKKRQKFLCFVGN